MQDAADTTLIESAQKGDKAAFVELVQRYQKAIWLRVHRILGPSSENEDAVQEIFLRIFTSLSRYDRRYPFSPWILRIATNYCIDCFRKRKSRKTRLWADLSSSEEKQAMQAFSLENSGAAMSPSDAESRLGLARALLEELNPRRRVAFLLREIENKTYREVAQELGVPEVAARVLVSRARADLQKSFLKHQTAEEKRK